MVRSAFVFNLSSLKKASVRISLIGGGADLEAAHGSTGSTPLHMAAAVAATDTVEILLAAGAWPASTDAKGQTPLHTAAYTGAEECVELLISADAHLDAIDAFGFSPLRWACLNGHAQVAFDLISAGADSETPLDGMSPLACASGAGHGDVIAALLQAGVRDDADATVCALEIARATGREDIADLLLQLTASVPCNIKPTPRVAASEPAMPSVDVIDADTLARDRWHWDAAFATSTPLLVRGAACALAKDISSCSVAELRRRWGAHAVTVAFSPDVHYQHPVTTDDGEMRFRETPTERMTFADFVDLLPHHGKREFFAVSQSSAPSLDVFEGLPSVPPSLARLLSTCTVHRSNLWACKPPKVSALHYDDDESVLLQLSGTKRFTLVAPAPLHGLSAYPSSLPVDRLRRVAPGVYEADTCSEEEGSSEADDDLDDDAGTPRRVNNFPLVNMSDPDVAAHPLFHHAQVMTVDVHEGDALLLPAYWYHQVESFVDAEDTDVEDSCPLNVAINYWFSREEEAPPAPSYVHRKLRERLRIEC